MKAFNSILAIIAALSLISCSESDSSGSSGKGQSDQPDKSAIVAKAGAPLFAGMGDHSHQITTSDPAAQLYFDQGLVLSFGFNHAESIRSFRAAQTLDPNCAMCFWGEALATGPNINVTSNGKAVMTAEARVNAYEALQKALSLKSNATRKEQDYIDALVPRYNGAPETDRVPLDLAYAKAMRELAAKYPEDDDASALFSEALMNTMPWDYWLDAENPKPATVEVLDSLENILDRNPEHPLALHLYIHAVEASNKPERAEQAADTLTELIPGSGHMVHMPSHIYWRIGRYQDAAQANIKAAAVDEAYMTQCNAQGFYPALYYPHNIHFLWAAASMQGNSELAISSARKVAANVHLEMIEQFPGVEFFKTIPVLALTRFSKWDDVLAEPMPPGQLQYTTAIYHYARGVAYARQADLAQARNELDALQPLMDSEMVHVLDGGSYPASQLLAIADHLLRGEIALSENHYEEAVEHYSEAVAGQDILPYTEPPLWYYPSRQSLGEALMKSGDYVQAEQVYRKDLEDYPKNGWSMFGLMQSLRAQGKQEEADQVKQQFEIAWAMADVELTSL